MNTGINGHSFRIAWFLKLCTYEAAAVFPRDVINDWELGKRLLVITIDSDSDMMERIHLQYTRLK